MGMNRRHALATLAGLGGLTWRGQLYAAPSAGARMLVVFLRGGVDSANVVAPLNSDFYREARPTLALGRPGSGPSAALALDGDWGLHPALGPAILPLFQKRQAAFIHFAGTNDLSRSHFETQNTMELGRADAGGSGGSGFLNRLAGVLQGSRPISFTASSPLIFNGPQAVAQAAVVARRVGAFSPQAAEVLAGMYAGTDLSAQVQAGFKTRAEVIDAYAAESMAADRGAVSGTGFRQAARRIGRLMRSDYDLGFIDVGGWDTHVNQAPALAARLSELGGGLADLIDELGQETWRKTVVVVMSEFGRTFRENGYAGTDHGHGGAFWVLGGGLQGGLVAGEQVRIERAALNQDRDLPVLNEYRAILGGLISRVYGLPQARLQGVFPAAGVRALRLICPSRESAEQGPHPRDDQDPQEQVQAEGSQAQKLRFEPAGHDRSACPPRRGRP